jgi:hypothetical protein
MKGYRVYNSIQQLKDMGFKRAAVAAQLQINRRTVDRYWTMTADEYEAQQQALKRGSSRGRLPRPDSVLAASLSNCFLPRRSATG